MGNHLLMKVLTTPTCLKREKGPQLDAASLYKPKRLQNTDWIYDYVFYNLIWYLCIILSNYSCQITVVEYKYNVAQNGNI